MFNQLTTRKQIPATHAALRIRQARHEDAAAVLRLAALDSSPVPAGDLLLAEVGEELWAAFSLENGDAIADPLRPSADAVLILGQRARQLHRAERRASHGRRPRSIRFAL
jgi:plasmid stability protein